MTNLNFGNPALQPPRPDINILLSSIISSLKLFHQDGEAKVALYGSPSVYEDGWLRNLPASQVFRQNPDVLPAEQTLPSLKPSSGCHLPRSF